MAGWPGGMPPHAHITMDDAVELFLRGDHRIADGYRLDPAFCDLSKGTDAYTTINISSQHWASAMTETADATGFEPRASGDTSGRKQALNSIVMETGASDNLTLSLFHHHGKGNTNQKSIAVYKDSPRNTDVGKLIGDTKRDMRWDLTGLHTLSERRADTLVGVGRLQDIPDFENDTIAKREYLEHKDWLIAKERLAEARALKTKLAASMLINAELKAKIHNINKQAEKYLLRMRNMHKANAWFAWRRETWQAFQPKIDAMPPTQRAQRRRTRDYTNSTRAQLMPQYAGAPDLTSYLQPHEKKTDSTSRRYRMIACKKYHACTRKTFNVARTTPCR